MAISVQQDLIKGHSYRKTATTREMVRTYYIRGLTPGPNILAQAYVAVDAVDPTNRVPPFGSVDAADNTLISDDYDPQPYLDSTDGVKMVVKFHPIDFSSVYQPLIKLTATSREVLTNYDWAGNPIKVQFTPPTVIPHPSPPTVTAVGQVSANKAFGILEIEHVEYSDPSAKLIYINKVNSNVFWGQPKWTWVCRLMGISKLLYTSGFKVNYQFEYDERTHIKTACYHDNLSGTIPETVDTNPDPTALSGNGWTNVRVNSEIAFSGLSLPGSF